MRNGSVRFISRFKFVIGAAVVAVAAVATTVALLSNPVPLNSQAAAGVAQFDASTDLTVTEGTTGTFKIEIGTLTAQSRLSLSIESGRTAAITGTQKDVTIQVGSTNVTTFPHTIVVESSTTEVQISVAATEDTFYEDDEEFTFKLETVMNGNITIGTAASRKLIVEDNDNVDYEITFQSGESELREMGASGSTSDVGLNVAIDNGDMDGVPANHTVALNSVDGITLPPTVTIMANSNSANFDAERANDNNWSGNFNVTISTMDGSGSLVVPVIDDDRPVVRIIAADGSDPITVTEGETNTDNLTLEVLLLPPSGVLSGDTTFKLQRNSSMSTTGSDDMVADVTVPAGMSSANFSFNAGTNSAFDPGIYVLEVHEAESLGKTVTPLESSVRIEIVDRNPLPITFTVDKTSVAENDADKMVTFRASIAPLPSLSHDDLVLVVSTAALTRVSADDVDMIPNELTIMQGQDTTMPYTITVTDDDEIEIDELLGLEITELRYRGGVSRNADGTALTSAVFRIVSDDTASWSLSAANRVAEGSDLAVTITSDKALPKLADPPDLKLVVTDRLGASVISAAIPRTSPLYSGMTTDVINIPNPHDDLFELDQMYTVRFAEGTTAALPLVGSLGAPLEYTVTDDPNEMPDITLDYGGATTVTEDGNINVIITIANAPDTGLGDNLHVKLALNTMNSTASAADISFFTGGIQIPRGSRVSGTNAIQANDDGMFDPGEVFELLVNSVWYGGDNNDPASGTPVTLGKFVTGGTIRVIDTDAPAVTLTRVASGEVTEGDVGQKLEIFEITLAEAVAVDLILDVDFYGTATRNTDYSAPDTVTIPAGQTSVNYTVTVIGDGVAEFDETVMLSISGGTTSDGDMFALASSQEAEFTITNDDIVMVTLAGPASAISESTASQIDITLSIPWPPNLSLRSYTWETLSGANFEDISSLPTGEREKYSLTGGNPNKDFLRNLGFDFEFFGQVHETVTINTNGYVVFTDDDDDAEDFKFENNFADQRFEKGTEENKLPIAAAFWHDLDIRTNNSSDAIYTATRGTAPNRRFIVQYEHVLHVSRSHITFQVVLFESTDQIEFRYEDVSTNHNSVAVGITDGSGTNFEEVGIGKTNMDMIVRDNTRVVFTPIRLDVVTKDDEDQRVGRLDLLTALMDGDTMRTISVPADLSNTDWEADRTFTAEARVANLPFVTLGSPVTYTVQDDDTPTVVLERADGSGPISITEGGSVDLRVRLTNAPKRAPEDLVVNLMADPAGTAMASEYSFPASVTIATGATERVFTVRALQDTLSEFDESLTIEVATLGYDGRTPSPASPVNIPITIKSDDTIGATISVSNGGGPEGGMVTARITLDELLPSQTPGNVLSLVLADGSTMNDDLEIVSKDITADLKSSMSTDVTIRLKEDALLEGDETVRVMLRITPGRDPDLANLLPIVNTSFKITDTNSGIVRLVPLVDTEYAEGKTVAFRFALPPGVTAAIPVTINYELTAPTMDGDNERVPADASDRSVTVAATGLGTGFAQGLALPVRGLAQTVRSVVIMPGESSVVLIIELTDDTMPEETELLGVRLMGVDAGPDAPRVDVDRSMDQTVIRILDNEDPVFEIIGDGEVDEDDGTYPVRLRRLGRISDNEIAYEIAGDGADAGDFAGDLTGKFKFSGNNALSEEILLILDDDSSEESEKTFRFLVTTPVTGARFEPSIFTSVNPNNRMSFTSITLLDSDAAFSGLPATGGPVLPVWLLLTLALTGVVLLVPTLRRLI